MYAYTTTEPFNVANVCMYLGLATWLNNQLASLSLRNTNFSFLNSHHLPVALNLVMGPYKISPINVIIFSCFVS